MLVVRATVTWHLWPSLSCPEERKRNRMLRQCSFTSKRMIIKKEIRKTVTDAVQVPRD